MKPEDSVITDDRQSQSDLRSVTDGNINCADCEKRKKVSILLKSFHKGVLALQTYSVTMTSTILGVDNLLTQLAHISTEIEALIDKDSTKEDEDEYAV